MSGTLDGERSVCALDRQNLPFALQCFKIVFLCLRAEFCNHTRALPLYSAPRSRVALRPKKGMQFRSEQRLQLAAAAQCISAERQDSCGYENQPAEPKRSSTTKRNDSNTTRR